MQQLCDWAEHTFKLNKQTKSGATEREHLEQVEKQLGRKIKGTDPEEEFPVELGYIWAAFIQLSNARTSGFSGPNPLTYSEIKAWMEVTDTPFKSWEVDAIKRIDFVYMGVANG